MAGSPSIEQIVAQIRTAIFGKDVRENIALGIEKCYEYTQDYVHTSDIANNLTTTTPGKVLDARQGTLLDEKTSDVLKSEYANINKFVSSIIDSNAIFQAGEFIARGIKGTWSRVEAGIYSIPSGTSTLYSKIESVETDGETAPTVYIRYEFLNSQSELINNYNQTVLLATSVTVPQNTVKVRIFFYINTTSATNTYAKYNNVTVSANGAFKVSIKDDANAKAFTEIADSFKESESVFEKLADSNILFQKKCVHAYGSKNTWVYDKEFECQIPSGTSTLFSQIGSVIPDGETVPSQLMRYTFYNGTTELSTYGQTVLVATINVPQNANKVLVRFGVNGSTASNTIVEYTDVVCSINKRTTIMLDETVLHNTFGDSKNIFVGEFKQAGINADTGVYYTTTGIHNSATEDMIPVKNNMMYTISFDWNENLTALYLFEYAQDGSYIGRTTIDNWTKRINARSFITSNTTRFVRFMIYTPDNTDFSQIVPHNVQVEIGGKATNRIGEYDLSNYVDYEKARNNKLTIPDYYFYNGYLENKVDTIRTLMSDASGMYDAFFFITDMHWEINQQHSPALIRYLKAKTNIVRLFNGGDIYSKWSQYYIDDAVKMIESSMENEHIYNVVGNHEYKGSYMTDPIVWMYLNSNKTDIIPGNSGRSYYYVDNPVQKIRYIVLSVYTDDGEEPSVYFEDAQKNWLSNVALNLDTGWSALIFSHGVVDIHSANDVVFPINNVTDDLYTIVDNYSGNGEIIAIIGGHTHRDRILHTPGGVPVIITTCDKNGIWINPETELPDIVETRNSGTIAEQAFDVFIVDKKNRILSMVRIGSKAFNGTDDNRGTQVEMRQVNFKSL